MISTWIHWSEKFYILNVLEYDTKNKNAPMKQFLIFYLSNSFLWSGMFSIFTRI